MEILESFSLNITATQTSELTGISKPATKGMYDKPSGEHKANKYNNEFPREEYESKSSSS